MRISAYFATFAILSYTKIIDNSWYLSHLLSYFLLGIQWVYAANGDNPYRTTSFPIAFPNGVLVCVANLCGYLGDTSDACVIWNDGQTTGSTVQFRLNGTTSSSPKCIAIGH